MPAHNHTLTMENMLQGGGGEINAFWQSEYQKESSGQHGQDKSAGTIGDSGGGGSHENRPPYYVLAYIMRIT